MELFLDIPSKILGKWMNMAIPCNSKCQFGKWIYILIISDMHWHVLMMIHPKMP